MKWLNPMLTSHNPEKDERLNPLHCAIMSI